MMSIGVLLTFVLGQLQMLSIIKNETDLEKHIHNVDRVDLLYVYSEMAAWEEYSKFFQNNGPRMMRERFGNRLKMGLFQLSDEVM